VNDYPEIKKATVNGGFFFLIIPLSC